MTEKTDTDKKAHMENQAKRKAVFIIDGNKRPVNRPQVGEGK